MKYFYSIITYILFSIFTYANFIGFEKNVGQIKNQNNLPNWSINHSLRLNGLNINLNKSGFNYDFYEKDKDYINTHRLEFIFKNYNKDYKILQINQSNYQENYISESNDLSISFYQKIIYKNFYNHIDIEFYINEDTDKPFEYNFVLNPGANINDIQFAVKGAKEKLSSNQLNFKLRFGELVESLPKSWIKNTNYNTDINVEYCYHENGNIGVQSQQDIQNKKVIIDPLPIRKWGSYLSKYYFNGYPTDNHYMSIDKVKFYGNDFYIFGTTSQKNLATEGAFQTTIINTYQPFLAKFNTESQRIWLTYYGSSHNTEYSGALDVDNNGDIYLTYTTFGQGMATPRAYKRTKNEYSDFLVTKFNKNGKRIWSTYYGGNFNDSSTSIVVDKINNVLYVGGSTQSTNKIHPQHAYIPENNNDEAKGLIAKFNLDGGYITSTYTSQTINGLDVNQNGEVIIIGRNNTLINDSTTDFLDTEGYVRISKFNSNLIPIWSKLSLGNSIANVNAIAHDSENNIIFTGATISTSDITFGNAYSTQYSFENGLVFNFAGFLRKIDTNGNDIFGTYIGEKGFTYINDVVIGDNNEIIIAGNATNKSKIVLSDNPHQGFSVPNNQINGNGNAVLMKFDKTGTPIWGFLAGDNVYANRYQSIDYNHQTKDIIAVGWNVSPTMIATPNGYQTKPIYDHEYGDLWGLNGTMTLYSDIYNDFKIEKTGDDCDLNSIQFTASGATNYTWYNEDGNIVSNTHTFKPNSIGQYTCKFEIGNTVGFISIIVIEANLGTPPIPENNTLPDLEAYCKIDLIAPKAFSGCGEEIVGTTDITLFDVPGEYIVTWSFTDKYGNNFTQDQKIKILSLDNFIPIDLEIETCYGNSFDLTSIEKELQSASYKYYKNEDDLINDIKIINPKNYNTKVLNDSIIIKGTLENGCSSTQILNLKTNDLPLANTLTKVLCDAQNLGSVLVNLSVYNSEINNKQNVIINYYKDSNYTNKINQSINIVNNDTIFVKVTDEKGCSNFSKIEFSLSNYTLLTSTPFEICKNSSDFGEFILSEKANEVADLLGTNANNVVFYQTFSDAQQNRNPISNAFSNNQNLSSIYATIITNDACKTFVEIPLVENLFPNIEIQDVYTKCIDQPITISIEGNDLDITWSNGQKGDSATFIEAGNYSVIVSNGKCTITKEFEIKDFEPLKFDYKYDGKSVTFYFNYDLNAKVSLDQINWNNDTFYLEAGEYTFYFKTSNGCEEIHTISLYKDLPSFISPNGDGINDFWDLSFVKNLKSITIFNRNGKTLFYKEKANQPIIWDGKINGKTLPSDTYWYNLKFEDDSEINGSILLKNK